MTHSDKAVRLVMDEEGLKLTAYQDGNGVWTIGYGHTGKFATCGSVISQSQAITILNEDLAVTDEALTRLVKVTLNQNQWDAQCSFVLNIGQGHFAKSTCLRLLNVGDVTGACAHMLDWRYVAGQVSQGLVNRRKKEQTLFLLPA